LEIASELKLLAMTSFEDSKSRWDFFTAKINFPEPSISMAVFPKSKGEEEKVASALQSMMKEDPTIKSLYNAETKELILSGLGALHIEVAVARVKERYGIDVERIAYRRACGN